MIFASKLQNSCWAENETRDSFNVNIMTEQKDRKIFSYIFNLFTFFHAQFVKNQEMIFKVCYRKRKSNLVSCYNSLYKVNCLIN